MTAVPPALAMLASFGARAVSPDFLIADGSEPGQPRWATATKQMQSTVALVLSIVLAACSCAKPSATTDIQSYTGIKLCPAAVVRDVNKQEEHDTTPGYSLYVALKLDAACAASFEYQLGSIAPVECASKRVHFNWLLWSW